MMYNKKAYRETIEVYVEPVYLKEVQAYVRLLYDAWQQRDVTKVRKYSDQILIWLCDGTRIINLKFILYQKAKHNLYGEYTSGTKFQSPKIEIYLGTHKTANGDWVTYNTYLNTLIHEWMHHYCYYIYGQLGADDNNNHEPIFMRRIEYALKLVKKDLMPVLRAARNKTS